ncbi:zinc finger CCHC domain-containing protein 8 [Oryzias melastigma]|uniref:zinc finger CCHC domain-containing protein 8 n=1 Tax=Oryzias melastigma TaxID=30732 RepID=UPI000CF83F19|nr:zinc finger CCHC domain-containing protein 8 [Oryzias melastigma]
MAEVDFGDSELFQQLDNNGPFVPKHIRFTDEDEDVQTTQLRNRLEECEDTIERLSEENKMLRRKLNFLTRPSGITIADVNIDGPLLQILYTNNVISKQCRQEIEDCVCKMILKHQKPGNENTSLYHMKPQNSSFALDEDPHKSSFSSVKTTTEAFKVVGSVLYFTSFSVDKLGQPLVNDNPQLTDGWDVPTYQQVFNQVIGTDGLEIEMKDKRPKSMCFNCGSSTHQLRDCPKPKDFAAISERRKEFNHSNNQAMQTNHRYHADEVEERFAKYKPGVMSEELLSALGLDNNTLPPLIYRMRQLGYPPGWLKEAEMENSGLSLYDGKASAETSGKDQTISYDVSKLVDFPGFNVPAPYRMRDEFMQYNSIPMQSVHMKTNYAAYLSSSFPGPDATCNKRQQEFDSSPQQKKKRRGSPDRNSDRSSDMDIESDQETSYHSPADFQFQTPLPPGSPCFSTPPPLPQGTPPATPTPPPLPKGTPPPTPTKGSPALRGQKWTASEGTEEGVEDDLTLEELEEQQRLIWAALENADTATNSDCETPAFGTPAPSSPNVSTTSHLATEMRDEVTVDPPGATESSQSSEFEGEPEVPKDSIQKLKSIKAEKDAPESPEHLKSENDSPQSPGPVKSQEDSPQSPGPVKSQEDSPQSPGPVKSQEDSPQSPGPEKSQEDSPQSPDPATLAEKVAKVPHRSKFAFGIVPFEDTPEFTELAEATGTYLKIRDLLKSSPRSLIKKK